jgi:hypothetical protein
MEERLMKTKYELPGGIITREGKKWRVHAPDGRDVGLFPTRKQAFTKAEHWDKWDALASLEDISMAMAPCMTSLVACSLASIKDGKIAFTPTNEQLNKAATLDAIYWVLRSIILTQRATNE